MVQNIYPCLEKWWKGTDYTGFQLENAIIQVLVALMVLIFIIQLMVRIKCIKFTRFLLLQTTLSFKHSNCF